MFITREAYKSPVSALLSGIGDLGWSVTEIALQQVWFLVQLEEIDADDDSGFTSVRTMLLFDFQFVEDVLHSGHNSGLRLKSVHIVTPSHVNGSDGWQMDQLRAVWQGREMVDEQEIPIDIFETVSGKKYLASFSSLPVEDLAGDTLKLKLSQ